MASQKGAVEGDSSFCARGMVGWYVAVRVWVACVRPGVGVRVRVRMGWIGMVAFDSVVIYKDDIGV